MIVDQDTLSFRCEITPCDGGPNSVAEEWDIDDEIKKEGDQIDNDMACSARLSGLHDHKDVSLLEMPSGAWLMDTGCACDLISTTMSEGYSAETMKKGKGGRRGSVSFVTANGRITTSTVVPMHCTLLDETITPYVLPATPAFLSIGRRCMEQGFSFYWDAGKPPVLVTPKGQVLPLSVSVSEHRRP